MFEGGYKCWGVGKERVSSVVDRPRRSDCTAGQMDGEAGWWTTSGNIGLPPLARAMGVGRQQQLSSVAKEETVDAIPGGDTYFFW